MRPDSLLVRRGEDVRKGNFSVELDALHEANDAAGHTLEGELLGAQSRPVSRSVHQTRMLLKETNTARIELGTQREQ